MESHRPAGARRSRSRPLRPPPAARPPRRPGTRPAYNQTAFRGPADRAAADACHHGANFVTLQDPASVSPGPPAHKPTGFCPGCGYAIDPGRCPECGREVCRPLKRPPRSLAWRCIRWTLVLGLVAIALSQGPYYVLYYLMPREWLVAQAVRFGPFSRSSLQVIRDQRLLALQTERAILNLVEAELRALDRHDWAGEYRVPDSVNRFKDIQLTTGTGLLILTPGGRYFWSDSDCIGCSQLLDWGQVDSLTDDRIRLVSDYPFPKIGAARKLEFVRHRRNGAHYLLLPDTLAIMRTKPSDDGHKADRIESLLIYREADRPQSALPADH